MSEAIDPTRRAKRLLSAEQKYEIWLKILCGELTTNEAAAVRARFGGIVSSGRRALAGPQAADSSMETTSVGGGCRDNEIVRAATVRRPTRAVRRCLRD